MSQRHTIQRTVVELQLPEQTQAHERQATVSRLFQEALPKAMDRVFSALSPANRLVKFDRLVVDLGVIAERDFSEANFETQCIAALEVALKKAINEQLSDNDVEAVFTTPEAAAFEAFVFFLKKGRLTWSFQVETEENWLFDVLTSIEKQADKRQILRGLILTNRMAALRLIQQCPLRFLWVLLNKLFPEWGVSAFEKAADVQNQALETAFWKSFLQNLMNLHSRKSAETVAALLNDITTELMALSADKARVEEVVAFYFSKIDDSFLTKKEKNTPLSHTPQKGLEPMENTKDKEQIEAFWNKNAHKESAEAKGEAALAKEPIYVNQAGLPIVLPFVDTFFKHIGLTEDKAFVNDTARTQAIHLLHYLATGKTEAAEYDLILEKIFCGVPLSMPIEREVVLTEKDIKSADNLLLAVIGYWSALGGCSVAGLRETFLQRPAILTITDDDNWRLQVERRTVDILMDKLPWGISMVKTSWMPHFMVVEW